MKQLLILGNGFDLSCGLKSTYNDFFEWRLNNLFKTTDVDNIIDQLNKVKMNSPTVSNFFEKTKNNGVRKAPEKSKFLVNKPPLEENKEPEFWNLEEAFPGITRWDIFFIYAKKYLQPNETNEWQDIERIIDNVIVVALHDKEGHPQFAPSKYNMNLHFKVDGESQFKKIIYKYACNNFNQTDEETRAQILLTQLLDFEKEFSHYIYSQMKMDENLNFESPYFQKAKLLLRKISNPFNEFKAELNVWSFNYTLGPRFKNKLSGEDWNVTAWNNIHGLSCFDDPQARGIVKSNDKIPAPVFGIDPDDDLSSRMHIPQGRVIFTKPYRIINNKFTAIRQEFEFNDFDKIIVYGHSLGKADYSYFKYIFDETSIYTRPIKLIFYYWPGLYKTDLVEKQLIERQYTEKVVTLLNVYGKDSNLARGDIVTKLAIEGRLSVLPNPDINL